MFHRAFRLALGLSVVFASGAALAQDGDADDVLDTRAPTPISGDALPGLGRIALPHASPWLLGASATAGYGYTESVLGTDDSHHRIAGRLSIGVQPLDFLQVALRLDGRYDSHSSSDADGDDGLVGDPRLIIRGFGDLGAVSLGGQVTLWVPGNDAPSFELAATTVDLELLAATSLGDLDLALNVGFRLDQSAESVGDAALLSGSDRISLGVSDSNAVLIGVGAAYRFGSQQIFGTWAWDVLVGDQAPSTGGSPMRVQAGFRYFPMDDNALQLEVAVDALLSSRPPADAASPLTPFYPRIGGHIAVAYRFPSQATGDAVENLDPDPVEDPDPVAELGSVSGEAADAEGNAIANAEVVLANPDGSWSETARTDEAGRYRFDEVPVGEGYRVTLRAEGYRDNETTVNVGAGSVSVPAMTVARDLPNGQIRGVVQSFRGEPVAATIRVEPFAGETVADEQGIFEIDVPPGAYRVTVSSEGFVEQTRPIIVEEQGVTILNVDLRSARQTRQRRRRSRRSR